MNKAIMPEEKLSPGMTILFSLQQAMACFSATVLVPLIVGLPVGTALFSAGVGTLIYLVLTQFKVPQYLGSSFAFIPALISVSRTFGWGAVSGAIIVSGVFYAFIAFIIYKFGMPILDKILPPVVIGPVIIAIGMSLLPTTVAATFGLGALSLNILVGLFTMIVIAFFSTSSKAGFLQVVPIFFGLIIGYIFQLILGLFIPSLAISFAGVAEAPWFALPFGPGALSSVRFELVPIVTFLIISIATVTEHIGDNYNLSGIVGREFYKDPGLHRTILGDGIASAVAGFFGSVPNTSYGESAAVQAMTKVHSVYTIIGASIFAILFSFCGKATALIATIPNPVLNGACLILYGTIAASGVRRLIDCNLNLSIPRNLIIISVILTIGIGSVALQIGQFNLMGVALATIVGIILNLVLPKPAVAQP